MTAQWIWLYHSHIWFLHRFPFLLLSVYDELFFFFFSNFWLFLRVYSRSEVTGPKTITTPIPPKSFGCKNFLLCSDFERNMFLITQFWKFLMSSKILSPVCIYIYPLVGHRMHTCVCDGIWTFLSCGNTLSYGLLESFYQFILLSAVY